MQRLQGFLRGLPPPTSGQNEVHSKLEPGDIRMMYLHPGKADDPLSCSLKTISLSSQPAYHAISYTWGDPDERHDLTCGNGKISITTNLYDALSAIRDEEFTRVLWAVQICINQADLEERAQQVKMMGDIFSQASKVNIWLSNEIWNNEAILESVQTLARMTNYPNPPPDHAGATLLNRSLYMKERLEDTTVLQHIDDIFSSTWFTRVWVIQEAVRAKDLAIMCGRSFILWDSGVTAILQMTDDYMIYNGNHRMRAKLIAHCRKLWHQGTKGRGEMMPMIHLMQDTWLFEATDSRDKIFALLGIAAASDAVANHLEINYTINIDELYARLFTIAAVRGNMLLLDYCGGIYDEEDALPSWMPKRSSFRTSDFQVHPDFYSASGREVTAITSSNDSDRVLLIRVTLLGTIKCLRAATRTIEDTHRDVTLSGLRDLACNFHSMHDQLHPVVFESTLSPTAEQEEDFSRLMLLDLSYDHQRLGSKVRAETIIKECLNGGYDRLIGDAQMTAGIAESVTIVSLAMEKLLMYQFSLIVHTEKLQAVRERPLFGWVHHSARSGDTIGIIHGFQMPVVLRPDGRGRYRFVGQAYFQGIMDGEAMEWEGFDAEDILLA